MDEIFELFSAATPALMRDALCIEYAEHRDDWWFAGDDAPASAAKSVCRSCLMRAERLAYALDDASLACGGRYRCGMHS